MSPKPKVQGPKSAAGVVCRVSQVVPAGHASRITHHASRFTFPSSLSRAFTLIEIMIVVGIMGIVMTMSVPIVYKVWRKAPMREAVKDIVEVCSHARARAIMGGVVTEVVFHPKDNWVGLVGAGAPRAAGEAAMAPGTGAPAASGSGLTAQLPKDIIIETLDINMSGIEYNDADEAKIRFYPNGISDEMRLILFDGRDRMGIELEITTGLANVVPNPLQEWSKR